MSGGADVPLACCCLLPAAGEAAADANEAYRVDTAAAAAYQQPGAPAAAAQYDQQQQAQYEQWAAYYQQVRASSVGRVLGAESSEPTAARSAACTPCCALCWAGEGAVVFLFRSVVVTAAPNIQEECHPATPTPPALQHSGHEYNQHQQQAAAVAAAAAVDPAEAMLQVRGRAEAPPGHCCLCCRRLNGYMSNACSSELAA